MEQHLEIFKHLEELYHGDTTDEAILLYAEKNSAKLDMWREAFEGYLLRDVLDTIDDYFAHKNNKTPPRISQIKAMLNASGIHAKEEITRQEVVKAEPDYDVKYQRLDKENGDMNWLVPHYTIVWRLIKQDRFPFVHNIKHPTHEEFRECMRRWCFEKYGKYNFCASDNDIKNMTYSERLALETSCKEIIKKFIPLKIQG